MSNKTRAFIIKPLFTNFNLTTLQYEDVLTYVSVRSFDNKDDGCFPAYETIAGKAGLGRTFTSQSIERLRKNGYIDILKRGYRSRTRNHPNLYSFDNYENFDCIPYEFFEIDDLSPNEKAMLLLLRQFYFSTCEIYGSIKEFASNLGLTYNVVSKQHKGLLKKGYLEKTRYKSVTKLARIDWFYPEHYKGFQNKPKIDYSKELEMLFMDTPSPIVLKPETVKSPEAILMVT